MKKIEKQRIRALLYYYKKKYEIEKRIIIKRNRRLVFDNIDKILDISLNNEISYYKEIIYVISLFLAQIKLNNVEYLHPSLFFKGGWNVFNCKYIYLGYLKFYYPRVINIK